MGGRQISEQWSQGENLERDGAGISDEEEGGLMVPGQGFGRLDIILSPFASPAHLYLLLALA